MSKEFPEKSHQGVTYIHTRALQEWQKSEPIAHGRCYRTTVSPTTHQSVRLSPSHQNYDVTMSGDFLKAIKVK